VGDPPTYKVYVVEERTKPGGERERFWHRGGSGWNHDDGKRRDVLLPPGLPLSAPWSSGRRVENGPKRPRTQARKLEHRFDGACRSSNNGECRGSCHGPAPTEGDFPRVLGCQNQCLPQSKLDVCPNAFAAMEERSGIAQYLIRPPPRDRMTQTTMTGPRTSCRKVGFPLSFPGLPANPRSQPVHPTAAARARQ
jgi:hypothetical protein